MKCPNCGRSNFAPIEGSGFRIRCLLCGDLCTREEAIYTASEEEAEAEAEVGEEDTEEEDWESEDDE